MRPPDRAQGNFAFEFIRPPGRRAMFQPVLLDATDKVIVGVLPLVPSKPLDYLGETVMAAGYTAVWFLFKDQPYDVGRCYRPDGTWTGYYVDILEPVRWHGSDPETLEPIVDLFLDLWIAPDGRYEILDEDEFEEAARLGHLTVEQAQHARRALAELIEATERGDFPPAIVRSFRLPDG